MGNCRCKIDTLSNLRKGYKFLDLILPKKEKKSTKKVETRPAPKVEEDIEIPEDKMPDADK